MKIEQTIILVFLVFGLVSGIVSNYIGNLILAILIPLVFYSLANILMAKLVKSRKFKVIVANSLATFLPLWLIVWIFLFNLG